VSAQKAFDLLQRSSLKLATAESCTGGMIAAAMTDIPGSSDVFDRGFVTYSNASKTDMLGVPAAMIESYGAVSAEVAIAMAEGALRFSAADVSVAVTGIAGPGGGSDSKPVGLVHFACARRGQPVRQEVKQFVNAGRDSIRRDALHHALVLVCTTLTENQ
jgi:nicotinamide-nucleotide amidase